MCLSVCVHWKSVARRSEEASTASNFIRLTPCRKRDESLKSIKKSETSGMSAIHLADGPGRGTGMGTGAGTVP